MKKFSNLEISRKFKLEPIKKIAKKAGFDENEIELYGDYKAKIKFEAIKKREKNKEGNLILVTATNPTKFGEGKTTVTIGLGLALSKMKKKTMICLREPSLGPVFGIKGGATGGGASQVLPVDEINLHFTGDIHAVTTANNLISAVIDNHLHFGNKLNIDPRQISWKRVLDMNDRALRNIVIGLGGKTEGVPREDHFDISVASEIMAILCLSKDIKDLKERVAKIIVATTYDGKPVTVADLKITGSVVALLKDALKPNIVQTTEKTPAFIHGGPFANIAHGTNSLMATKLALKIANYVVTEAGFGADLGAEKYFNITSRIGNLKPKAVVIVTTVRALKYHGENNLEKGLENLGKHIENIKKFNLNPVVAINVFPDDKKDELTTIKNYCEKLNTKAAITEVFSKGSDGGLELAEYVLEAVKKDQGKFKQLYPLNINLTEKIKTIAKEIYGANDVVFTEKAIKQIKKYEDWGHINLPVCIAKTQYSLSDNQNLLGRPTNFKITVREVRLSAGAGFFVALTGDIMTMPGLPKIPAAEGIDLDDKNEIVGM
ncbi:MAG: formate--tetrahydrofolate ligase [Patescibacteria group bacterium]|nr:formate--tetrahydrofolate ligase [Patescibacteria group bacterium]